MSPSVGTQREVVVLGGEEPNEDPRSPRRWLAGVGVFEVADGPTTTREAEYQFGEAESLGSTPLERPVERPETSLSDRFRFGVEPPS